MRSHLSCLTFLVCLSSLGQIESRLLSPLPDQARDDATGFSIDGIGYIQGGRMENFAVTDQLWSYNPAVDIWEEKAPLPGIQRQYASSFVLDGKAYLLGGAADPGLRLKELWSYDPIDNAWAQLNDFPGDERYAMTAFVYQGVAYAGLGAGYNTFYDDLWRYDSVVDDWELLLHFPMALYSPVQFALNSKVYIGTGQDADGQPIDRMWSFDGESIHHEQDYLQALTSADALRLGDYVLIIGGSPGAGEAVDGLSLGTSTLSNPGGSTVHWEQKQGIAGGEARSGAVFNIGDNGYYYGGKNGADVRSNRLIEFSIAPKSNSLGVYPNPACAELLIESEAAFDKVSVFSIDGKRVFEQRLAEPSTSVYLSLDDFALGTYLIQAGEHGVKTVMRVCGQ